MANVSSTALVPHAGGYRLGMATTLKDALTMEPTKAELYAEARRLGIRGRSRMNKGAPKSAVERRRDKLPVMEPRI